MNQSNFVILGGGMVAGYAAKQLVELGLPKGELAILSADNAIPYDMNVHHCRKVFWRARTAKMLSRSIRKNFAKKTESS